jgi:hypothetical protein
MLSHTSYLLSSLLNASVRHGTLPVFAITPRRRGEPRLRPASRPQEQKRPSLTGEPWTNATCGWGRTSGSSSCPTGPPHPPGTRNPPPCRPFGGPVGTIPHPGAGFGTQLEITHESADGKGWTPLEPIEADQCRARTNPPLADRPPGRAVSISISRRDRTRDLGPLGTLTDPAAGSGRPAFGPRW